MQKQEFECQGWPKIEYRYGPFPVTRPRIAFVERDNVIRGRMTAAERMLCSPSLPVRRSCRIAELESRGFKQDKDHEGDFNWFETTLACHLRVSKLGMVDVFRRMSASCYHRASALVYDEPARALALYRQSELYEQGADEAAERVKRIKERVKAEVEKAKPRSDMEALVRQREEARRAKQQRIVGQRFFGTEAEALKYRIEKALAGWKADRALDGTWYLSRPLGWDHIES